MGYSIPADFCLLSPKEITLLDFQVVLTIAVPTALVDPLAVLSRVS